MTATDTTTMIGSARRAPLTRAVIGELGVVLPGEEARLEGTLADRLQDGPLPPRDALVLLSEVGGTLTTLAAFAAPHDHVVPEAILLTRTRPAHALVRVAEDDPEPGAAGARPDLLAIADYLAPEVAAGGPRTAAADVYALACVLVEALTGVPPFAYDRPALVLAAHREAPPPPVAAATGLPQALDRVLATALAKDPEQRQRSTANLMRAAQRALGPHRHPIPVLQPTPRADAAGPSPSSSSTAASPSGRRRSRRSRRPAPSAPSRRRARSPVAVLGGAVGLAAAVVGFTVALSRAPSPASEAVAAVAAPAALAVVHPEAGERGTVVGAVDAAMARLDRERATGRSRLRAATAPAEQAAAARTTAAAYRSARQALPPPAALVAAPAATHLPDTLVRAQRAYYQLARAIDQGNAHAYWRAGNDIRVTEATLDDLLRRVA